MTDLYNTNHTTLQETYTVNIEGDIYYKYRHIQYMYGVQVLCDCVHVNMYFICLYFDQQKKGVDTYVYVYVYVYVYIYIYISMSYKGGKVVDIYVYVCICIYIYIYISMPYEGKKV